MPLPDRLLPLFLTPALFAQQWARVDEFAGSAVAVFDPLRGRAIGVGQHFYGARLWEFDGVRWIAHAEPAPAGQVEALVFDAVRRRLLAFAYEPYSATAIQANDGVGWTTIRAATAPPSRSRPQVVWDEARGRLVLFGGGAAVWGTYTPLDDMWTWDGTNWTQLAPPLRPTPRFAGGCAYDPVRQRMVLFGGEGSGSTLQDTWEWDGSNWRDLAPVTGPGPQLWMTMAFDPASARVVLVGSPVTASTTTEAWAWDGAAWARLQAVGGAPPAMFLARDATSLLLCGGRANFEDERALLRLGPTGFVPLPVVPEPETRAGFDLAYDPIGDGFLLFGGRRSVTHGNALLAETWRWRRGWQRLQPSTSPPAREGHAMAHDVTRGAVVLFGGAVNGVAVADTWTWNGTDWRMQMPVTSPPSMSLAAMASHDASGIVVLNGEQSPSGLNQTWLWDGLDWTRANSQSLYGRPGVMAYDRQRARIVRAYSNGTDEWNGSSWLQMAPTLPSSGRAGLVFDPVRARVVAISDGGLHQWDGVTWSALISTLPRIRPRVALDPVRGDILAIVESGGGLWSQWLSTPAPALVVGLGGSCGLSPPVLSVRGRPTLGVSFDFAIDAGTAAAPIVLAVSLQPAAPPGPCAVVVGWPAELAFAQAANNGVAILPVPMADVPALRGLRVVAQAFGLAGVAVSASGGVAVQVGD
ncbi:MAG: hypothetical protein IPK26_01430 [Planctomycetes bacterium]|nr:hypothetical protein [Planctomycetota bacterium]